MDYDIDKAYIMGLEFGDDGKLIKWSNLFNYSSPSTLEASLWLPTPRKIKIYNNSSNNTSLLMNISKLLSSLSLYLNPITELDKAIRIRKIADLIIDIYDYIDKNGIKGEINLVYSKLYSEIAKSVIDDIIKHERTVISPNLEEAAYKNSISASIRNIVLDLKNMNLAYSPITMKDLQDLADNSSKGSMTASLSMMNPLTKYIMLVLNMTGKKVIGIAAVAEKIFFNLSYYYNEGIRSNNENWIRNMQFSKTFSRIQNRYNSINSGNDLNNLLQATKTSLANINFLDHDYIRSRFITISLIDEECRKKFNITNNDIINHTGNWELYNSEVERLVKLLSSNDLKDVINLHKNMTDIPPVDLMISLILSAATDFRSS